MPEPFSRTRQSLAGDRHFGSLLAVLLVFVLLTGWLGWFTLAHVTLYEVTEAVQLQVDRETHPVDASLAGRVVATRLVLGQVVRAGEVLAEIDAQAEALRLQEARSRLAAIGPQLAAILRQIAVQERLQQESRQAGRVVRETARARSREAGAETRISQEEARRLAALHAEGTISELEYRRSLARAQVRREAGSAAGLDISRAEWSQRIQISQVQAEIEELRRQAVLLQTQIPTTRAAIRILEQELAQRRVRAPVGGVVAEVAGIKIGSVVSQGQRLGAIVPPGPIRAVAFFPPDTALGLIRVGQPARLRLHSFPWTQYGILPARVSAVASEVRDGRVRVDLTSGSAAPAMTWRDGRLRVELTLMPGPRSLVPLIHGLQGSAEVQVERITPAALVGRVVGHYLTRPVKFPATAR